MRELFTRLGRWLRGPLTLRLEVGTADVIRPGDVVLWCVNAPMTKQEITGATATFERLYPGVRFTHIVGCGSVHVSRDQDRDDAGSCCRHRRCNCCGNDWCDQQPSEGFRRDSPCPSKKAVLVLEPATGRVLDGSDPEHSGIDLSSHEASR